MTFFKNCWYVAGLTKEFEGETLVSRMICNERIVMFRKSTGEIAALEDRCPHRFVPLSMGNRIEDTIQCAYHGLRFDGAGACVDAPNDDEAQRARMCTRSYPAVERYAAIWLWMGDAELADPATIPTFDFLDDSEHFASVTGYTYMKANYQLIVDNLLDLSHIHYLHPGVHAGSDFSQFENKVRMNGDEVWSMLWRHHYYVDEKRQQLYGFTSDDVEGQGHGRWSAPGVLLVDTAMWEHGKGLAEAVRTPSAHLLTPETEFTTHYFWGSGRNHDLDNQEMSDAQARLVKMIFETQDGPIIEAQQVAMGTNTDFLDMQPMILRADAAGLAARRVMKRLIRKEVEETSRAPIAAE